VKLRNCVACSRSVLELRGQFALLDSFYVDDDCPPLESTGLWHARCLGESSYGEAWFAAKRRNFVSVRRYEEVAVLADCSVLRNRNTRDLIAIEKTGMTLSLSFSSKRPKPVEGGFICMTSEDFNLELDDREVIREVQDALEKSSAFALGSLFERLEISDRIHHPEAMEGSALRYSRDMPGRWEPDFVCGRAEYGVFVPAALEPYLTR